MSSAKSNLPDCCMSRPNPATHVAALATNLASDFDEEGLNEPVYRLPVSGLNRTFPKTRVPSRRPVESHSFYEDVQEIRRDPNARYIDLTRKLSQVRQTTRKRWEISEEPEWNSPEQQFQNQGLPDLDYNVSSISGRRTWGIPEQTFRDESLPSWTQNVSASGRRQWDTLGQPVPESGGPAWLQTAERSNRNILEQRSRDRTSPGWAIDQSLPNWAHEVSGTSGRRRWDNVYKPQNRNMPNWAFWEPSFHLVKIPPYVPPEEKPKDDHVFKVPVGRAPRRRIPKPPTCAAFEKTTQPEAPQSMTPRSRDLSAQRPAGAYMRPTVATIARKTPLNEDFQIPQTQNLYNISATSSSRNVSISRVPGAYMKPTASSLARTTSLGNVAQIPQAQAISNIPTRSDFRNASMTRAPGSYLRPTASSLARATSSGNITQIPQAQTMSRVPTRRDYRNVSMTRAPGSYLRPTASSLARATSLGNVAQIPQAQTMSSVPTRRDFRNVSMTRAPGSYVQPTAASLARTQAVQERLPRNIPCSNTGAVSRTGRTTQNRKAYMSRPLDVTYTVPRVQGRSTSPPAPLYDQAMGTSYSPGRAHNLTYTVPEGASRIQPENANFSTILEVRAPARLEPAANAGPMEISINVECADRSMLITPDQRVNVISNSSSYPLEEAGPSEPPEPPVESGDPDCEC